MPIEDDIHSAAAWGRIDAMSRLLEAGASVATLNAEGLSPLHLAAYRNHLDAVRMLLNRGANVELGGPNNYTPLMVASRCGWGDVIQLLIDHGANVNAETPSGDSPLTFAAGYCHQAYILELLLGQGADVERFGGPALLEASFRGYVDNVARLLKAGAAINFKDHSGKTALDYAIEKGRTGVIILLKDSKTLARRVLPTPHHD